MSWFCRDNNNSNNNNNNNNDNNKITKSEKARTATLIQKTTTAIEIIKT